ncbi:hypothetical protein BVJ64_03290 [Vibrio cholerae]|nr:hypothetical protein [Vibrio cholerae]
MGNLLVKITRTPLDISFLLEAAAVLATFVHPNHIVCLCSWGLTHLPPTCNSKLFGYIHLPRWHSIYCSSWLMCLTVQ